MANIQDLIQQIVGASATKVNIPADIKDQVLGGLSNSILGSLTQTATQAGGLDMIKNLLTGKADAASSPITALAGNLFSDNVIKKLNLGSLAPALTALIPGIMGKLSSVIKDQDGDGDVDLNDILLSLKGGAGAGLLGAATSILGGLFGKKK
jgi:hypothetical protein